MDLISALLTMDLLFIPGFNLETILAFLFWFFRWSVYLLIFMIVSYLLVRILFALLFPLIFRYKNYAKAKKPIEMPALKPVFIPTRDQKGRCKGWFKKTALQINCNRKWRFIENWSFTLPATNKHGPVEIVIPKDFTSDGVSAPRFLWGVASPVGVLPLDSPIHDYASNKDFLKTRNEQGEIVRFDDNKLGEKNNTPWQRTKMWDGLFLEIAKEVNGLWPFNHMAYFLLLSASTFKHIFGKKRSPESALSPNPEQIKETE